MIEYRNGSGTASASDGVLNGLVTPFNVWTTIGDVKRGGFKERIAPGTFSKTLQERDVVLVNSHNTGQPMARTSVKDGPGSLALTEDSSAGLRARAVPVDTSYARDVMALTSAGVVRGMSFGFEVIKDSWTDDAGNPSDAMRGTQRTIHEVRLHEVTTTAFPAYATTELSARDAINAARGIERRAMATCVDCDKPVSADDTECPNCGRELDASDSDGRRSTRASDDSKPYGDVEYADPKNGKYPIDTEEHAKAAWAYINVAKNADEYPLNGVTLEDVKAKIRAALEKFGVEISEDERTLWRWLNGETRSPGDALLEKAAEFVSAYNALPADQRAEVRAAIMNDTEPAETTPDEDAEYESWKARALLEYARSADFDYGV